MAPKRAGSFQTGCRVWEVETHAGPAMPRFGRREAAREVEKVEKGARTLKRRLLDDDEKNAPSVATTRGSTSRESS